MLTADHKICDDLLSIQGYAGDELETDDPRVLTLEPLQAVGTGKPMKKVVAYESNIATKKYCFAPLPCINEQTRWDQIFSFSRRFMFCWYIIFSKKSLRLL